MLDRDERDKLREIERQINAADPELAAYLRDGQRRRPRASTRIRLLRVMIALLVLFTAVLLVLGLPTGGLAAAAVAAGLWWLRRRCEPRDAVDVPPRPVGGGRRAGRPWRVAIIGMPALPPGTVTGQATQREMAHLPLLTPGASLSNTVIRPGTGARQSQTAKGSAVSVGAARSRRGPARGG
jgi:hypothetical protein